MSNKKDLISIGEAYGDILNGLKSNLNENKTVPVGVVGKAPLESGGPEERGGFRPAEVDINRMSEKDKEDNIYNIGGLTYGDGNDPGIDNNEPHPTGPTYGQVAYTGNVGPPDEDEEEEEDDDENEENKKKGDEGEESEEDEEILAEREKIARNRLNNFMSKTSVFDKLYKKVMVQENFGEEVEDVTELEALGIETDEVVDEVPEEIAVTIPGELAQTLCDILQTAIAQQETEVDIDVDVETITDTDFEEDAETAGQKRYGGNKGDHPRRFNKKTGRKSEVRDYEEDEEATMKDGGGYGVDAGSTLNKEINYGKKNKVGNLKPATGLVQKDGGGYGVDAGSTLSKEINYGKQNKVGNIKLGSIPGA
tara:strand:- start:754 stop:1851 length:1098 start_codon:yes stop_codon:yes gene_type:complete